MEVSLDKSTCRTNVASKKKTVKPGWQTDYSQLLSHKQSNKWLSFDMDSNTNIVQLLQIIRQSLLADLSNLLVR